MCVCEPSGKMHRCATSSIRLISEEEQQTEAKKAGQRSCFLGRFWRVGERANHLRPERPATLAGQFRDQMSIRPLLRKHNSSPTSPRATSDLTLLPSTSASPTHLTLPHSQSFRVSRVPPSSDRPKLDRAPHSVMSSGFPRTRTNSSGQGDGRYRRKVGFEAFEAGPEAMFAYTCAVSCLLSFILSPATCHALVLIHSRIWSPLLPQLRLILAKRQRAKDISDRGIPAYSLSPYLPMSRESMPWTGSCPS